MFHSAFLKKHDREALGGGGIEINSIMMFPIVFSNIN